MSTYLRRPSSRVGLVLFVVASDLAWQFPSELYRATRVRKRSSVGADRGQVNGTCSVAEVGSAAVGRIGANIGIVDLGSRLIRDDVTVRSSIDDGRVVGDVEGWEQLEPEQMFEARVRAALGWLPGR